jgi:hypothetical protein
MDLPHPKLTHYRDLRAPEIQVGAEALRSRSRRLRRAHSLGELSEPPAELAGRLET